MILLSEKNERRFILLTNAILVIALLLLLAAFAMNRFMDNHIVANTLSRIVVVLILLSTPLRLLALGHLFRVEGRWPNALVALGVVAVLIIGGLAKWYFL